MAETTNVAIQKREHEGERSAEAIRSDIAAKRESISDTVDKLGERLHETLDWREYVANHPGITLGLAAGAGFLIAGVFKHRPTPQERIMDAVAALAEDATDRVGDVMAGMIRKKLVSGSTLKAGITAIATKAAVDFLKNRFAGNGRQMVDRRQVN